MRTDLHRIYCIQAANLTKNGINSFWVAHIYARRLVWRQKNCSYLNETRASTEINMIAQK